MDSSSRKQGIPLSRRKLLNHSFLPTGKNKSGVDNINERMQKVTQHELQHSRPNLPEDDAGDDSNGFDDFGK